MLRLNRKVSKGLPSTRVEIIDVIDDFSKAQDEKASLLNYLCLNPEATASALLCYSWWFLRPNSTFSIRTLKPHEESLTSTDMFLCTRKSVTSSATETRVHLNLNKPVYEGRSMKHDDGSQEEAV